MNYTSDASRPLPYNIDAEEAVIGSLMIDNAVTRKVMAILKETDFYREKHQWVWSALIDLYEQGKPVDPLTLSDYLERTDQLNAVGGPAALSDFFQRVPTAINAEYYAGIVANHATLRDLVGAAEAIARFAYESEDAQEACIKSERLLLDVVRGRGKRQNTAVGVGAAAEAFLENLQLIHMQDAPPMLPISLPRLKRILQGWKRKRLYLFMAPTGVGKTTFCVHEALSLAQHGKRGAIFSLEMDLDEMVAKCIAWLADVDSEQILLGYQYGDDNEDLYPFRKRNKRDLERAVADAAEQLRALPLTIIAPGNDGEGRYLEPDFSDYGIRVELLNLAERVGGIDYWAVDNAPLVKTDDKGGRRNSNDMLGDVGMMFKNLSIETDSVCILPHQPQRDAMTKSAMTTIHHSGESKKLIDNSPTVLTMDSPYMRGDETAQIGDRQVHVGKNRGGRTGLVKGLHVELATGRFSDPATRDLEVQAERVPQRQRPTPPPMPSRAIPFEEERNYEDRW